MKDKDILSMGIPGLDHILRGGLPRNRLYLISGDPGVGKTTLALQYMIEGARQGEAVLYITLSESRDEVDAVARSHGWSLEGVSVFELNELQTRQAAREGDNYVFHPDEVELGEVVGSLLAEIERLKPQRVVFDSLSELRLLSQGALRYRRQILALKHFFAGRNCTALLLDDRSSETGDIQLESICHGVIDLELHAPSYGAARRKLRVAKVRGLDFRSGYHDFTLTQGGITVYPRLIAQEHRGTYEQELLKTGIPALDDLLGGGIHRGRSAIIAGSAGSGKSTIAAQFVTYNAARGNKAKFFMFEERPDTLLMRAQMLSIDLEGQIKAGNVALQQIDPAEMSQGEFGGIVLDAVERGGARIIVIDSLNGFLSAMSGQDTILQLHELLTYLGQRGVSTLLVLGQQGLMGTELQVPLDISYLSDTIILLRFFESTGALRKAISIVKQRTAGPELTLREFTLGKDGIHVGKPLTNFQGVLTGVPRFVGSSDTLMGKEGHGA